MTPADEKSPPPAGTGAPPPPFRGVRLLCRDGLTPARLAPVLDPLPAGPPECRDGERPAAVLLALRPGRRGPEVLLVRRSAHLDEHAGQIALPGGRMDPGDADPAATALREALEEVRLDPGQVRLLGALGTIRVPVSRHHVVPVVGWLDDGARVALGSAESSELWFTPVAELAELAQPAWLRGQAAWEFPLPGARVWGMTAWVLGDFLRRLDDLDTRTADPNPDRQFAG